MLCKEICIQLDLLSGERVSNKWLDLSEESHGVDRVGFSKLNERREHRNYAPTSLVQRLSSLPKLLGGQYTLATACVVSLQK